MFGLGPTELIVILVLGVLLLGPQRIPEFATSLGKAIRSFRRATKELRDQIDIEDEVRRPLEDLRAALRDEPPPPPPRQAPIISPPAEGLTRAGAEVEPDLLPATPETPAAGADKLPGAAAHAQAGEPGATGTPGAGQGAAAPTPAPPPHKYGHAQVHELRWTPPPPAAEAAPAAEATTDAAPGLPTPAEAPTK
jgi:sec-independent protein translocase protein TatB